jgi:putative membrane protein
MMDGGMEGWGWLWGALMMVLFWGGLVAAIAIAVRASSSSRRGARDERPDAEAILAERFARGEISRDEFEERRKVLHGASR